VKVMFEAVTEDVTLPKFTLVWGPGRRDLSGWRSGGICMRGRRPILVMVRRGWAVTMDGYLSGGR